ncbi:hypothetical protein [uncultured Chryseobacterium sp.]|uniref:hypothetical protein n=1 Tax=uncultured Chryseobacterium sp. TaxID=259322 RepID=UPI002626360C|nr:hypothetical protein [uncultured Chryseobacterium sp.]
MKKLFLIGFLYSFSILFSQAKEVQYTDFIDFSDASGTKYNVMIVTDGHDNKTGLANSTVRVLYTTSGEEHLIEYYADCYLKTLSNGNTKISFIPTKTTSVQIIKGKDVSYSPDTFEYEVETKTNKITGTQSDKNSKKKLPIVYKNPSMSTTDRLNEIHKFYFRTEPMYKQLQSFYDKKLNETNKPYFDALGWFGSDGTAYQAFIVSVLTDQGYLNSTIRVRFEKKGEIHIVEYKAKTELTSGNNDIINISIKPNTNTPVKNIKGNSNYDPDSFSYTIDGDDQFISGKQSDKNSSAALSYIKITDEKEFGLKFYSEKDEIYQKYIK